MSSVIGSKHDYRIFSFGVFSNPVVYRRVFAHGSVSCRYKRRNHHVLVVCQPFFDGRPRADHPYSHAAHVLLPRRKTAVVEHALASSQIPQINMAKTIFSGLEDSGKSLMLATYAGKIIERNADWLKKGCQMRPLVSNLEFQQSFLDYAKELGIEIRYWKDLEELPALKDCDLIIDEVGAYFDSRTFKDLPLDIRLWLAQASKLGVDIYGSAQDFAQVDLTFRRLTTQLFHITKLIGSPRPTATRPPVKRIWGMCMVRELDPVGYDEQKRKFNNSAVFPSWFFIRKEYCEIFDTTKRIAKTKPPPYKHVERRCVDPDCKFEMYITREGHKHKISHT